MTNLPECRAASGESRQPAQHSSNYPSPLGGVTYEGDEGQIA
jgi:hypothetical protein